MFSFLNCLMFVFLRDVKCENVTGIQNSYLWAAQLFQLQQLLLLKLQLLGKSNWKPISPRCHAKSSKCTAHIFIATILLNLDTLDFKEIYLWLISSLIPLLSENTLSMISLILNMLFDFDTDYVLLVGMFYVYLERMWVLFLLVDI